MIRYSLTCDHAHAFDGWFSGSADFDSQRERGLVSCPVCNSQAIDKTLMAPSVSTGRKKEAMHTLAMDAGKKEVLAKIRETVAGIRASAEDVGDRFPEEARKIHYGEAQERGIIGQASIEDVKALVDEGIEVAPLPLLPDDVN